MSGKASADLVLFAIGATGACWEIFVHQGQNPYVYALIAMLLKLGTGLTDVISKKMTDGNSTRH